MYKGKYTRIVERLQKNRIININLYLTQTEKLFALGKGSIIMSFNRKENPHKMYGHKIQKISCGKVISQIEINLFLNHTHLYLLRLNKKMLVHKLTYISLAYIRTFYIVHQLNIPKTAHNYIDIISSMHTRNENRKKFYIWHTLVI